MEAFAKTLPGGVTVYKHPSRIVAHSRTSLQPEFLINRNNNTASATTILKSKTRPILLTRPRLEELRAKLKQDSDVTIKPIRQPSSASATKEIFTNTAKGCGASLLVSDSSKTTPIEENISAVALLLEKLRKEQLREQPNNKSLFLQDTYNRQHTYLRISLTERCNLRCQYCMPPEGVPLQPSSALLSTLEIYKLVRIFASMGVNKIRLTGGEPLLRADLVDIVSHISSNYPDIESVGMTTNGITLSRHLPSLVDAGLTHVNVSLDTLHEEKFVEITRRKGLQKVLKSIRSACELLPAGTGKVKVNCVVMKGFNECELRNFIMLSKDFPLDVRFIEWMPFNDNGWSANRFMSYPSMLSRISTDETEDDTEPLFHKRPHPLRDQSYIPPIQLERLMDSPNDTTKWYTVPGHLGRVGFITSMSEQFCSSCNRIRLTADGKLKVCLFGSEEVSLRDALRGGVSNDDLELLIGAAVMRKKFALGGHGDMHGIKMANSNRPMTLIGG